MGEVKILMLHHGISPWELEVAYGIFAKKFIVEQKDIEYDGDEYSSILEIDIPVIFGDAFFDWFGRKEWDKIKFLLKEMKRRRGGRKAIKTVINFAIEPAVRFVVDAHDRDWYNNAVEKIDFMTELMPHHFEIPKDLETVTYMRKQAFLIYGEDVGNKSTDPSLSLFFCHYHILRFLDT